MLSLLQIIKEELEDFYDYGAEPSMSDRYLQKNTLVNPTPTEKINAELIGYIYTQYGRKLPEPIPVYKNPKSLIGFGYNTRGIILADGDFYLAKTWGAMHDDILEMLSEKNIISYDKIYNYFKNLPEEFIAVQRVGTTDRFAESEAYDIFPDYYEEIFQIANQLQPFEFKSNPLENNIREIESPLDPNLQGSNIPAGHKFNIVDELNKNNMKNDVKNIVRDVLKEFTSEQQGEKYYLSTDKTGRGEKPIKITKTQIENKWDLSELSWFDVPLGEYLEESYIGDVWENRTEKLECIEIH